MKKVFLNKEDVIDLHNRGCQLMPLNEQIRIQQRCNRVYFYPEDCKVGGRCGLWGGVNFPQSLGSYSYSFSALETWFSIGNYCSIAAGLKVMGYSHPMERFTTSSITYDNRFALFVGADFKMEKRSAPQQKNCITVEDDVWIGENVTLKKGVTLHTGCVVGAHSLVTHDVPPYAVVGGIPAKIIKYRFDSYIIDRLLESKWFDYDINYLGIPSNIYVYDFIKCFLENKDKLPKLNYVKLQKILEPIAEREKQIFVAKIKEQIKTGSVSVSKGDVMDTDKFVLFLEQLCQEGKLRQNDLSEMCFCDLERKMFLEAFLRLEQDEKLEFFSMKNEHELWLHYAPYVQHGKSRVLTVPVWGNGKTWPGADRENNSAFAAYMRLMGSDVFISIEMSAKDTVKARNLAKTVGYEEKNSPGGIIRLLTKRIPIKGENGLAIAVNEAMDEFCKLGEEIIAALEGAEV